MQPVMCYNEKNVMTPKAEANLHFIVTEHVKTYPDSKPVKQETLWKPGA